MLRLTTKPFSRLKVTARHNSTSAGVDTNQHIQQSQPRPATLAQTRDKGAASSSLEEALLKTTQYMNASSRSPSRTPSSRYASPKTASANATGGGFGAEPALSKLGARLVLARKAIGAFDIDATAIANTAPSGVNRRAQNGVFNLSVPGGGASGGNRNFRERMNERAEGVTGSRNNESGQADRRERYLATRNDADPRSASALTPAIPRLPGSSPRSPSSPLTARPRSPNAKSRSPASRPRNNSSSFGAPKQDVKLIDLPSRFTGMPKLDLATLIREDIAAHRVVIRPGMEAVIGNGKVGGKGIVKRMAARREAQGDYTRFLDLITPTDGATGQVRGDELEAKVGHAERARRILISNSTIGLNGREFLVNKVEQLVRR